MSPISSRAISFLASQKRHAVPTDRDEIIAAFRDHDAPVFEPLIEFQQQYGGYEFMAGPERVHVGLLQGDGGFPTSAATALVEFSYSDNGASRHLFVCANSNYPMNFNLDEHGRYYEDFELVASSYHKAVEHLAIWDELKRNANFKLLVRDERLGIPELAKKLSLTIIPEASDDYTSWFSNDATYLMQCQGLSTIVTADDPDAIISVINE